MTPTFDDYDTAVRAYWTGRSLQAQKQTESGKHDAGLRGTATGGKHLDAMQQLIASQFEPLTDLGAVVRCTGRLSLPGWYRRTKDWDIVVTYESFLIAAIECKSHNGPSFSNNFNNRTEEAIGNSIDLWRAYREGYLGDINPWLAFVMVVERAHDSTKPVQDRGNILFPPDPVFDHSSYTDRYGILFDRLVRDRHYDAACLISSVSGQGIYSQPVANVSTANLTAAIAARITFIKHLIDDGRTPSIR